MSSAPASLTVIAEGVERRLRALLDAEIERWRALDPDLVAPLESLGALVLAGGKRLRPAFCHWGFVGAGGDADDPVVVDAGAAFELLHAFALVHDDVMDGSATRRGVRTAHLEFADSPRARRLARRSAAASARAWRSSSATSPSSTPTSSFPTLERRGVAVWNELRIELNVGQYLDILGTARGDDRTAWLPSASRATSRASTRSSGRCTSAPALAGRFDDLAPALSAFGLPLGDAFQLRDDVLGAFGESAAHRQARRRRPPRGQADAAARDRREPRRRSSTPSCSHRVGLPISTTTRSPRSRPCSSTPARRPRSKRRSPRSPSRPSARSLQAPVDRRGARRADRARVLRRLAPAVGHRGIASSPYSWCGT